MRRRRSVTSIVVDDTIVDSADSTSTPAASSASRTSYTSDGSHVIRQPVAVAGDVVGAGLERGHHHVVLAHRRR